MVNFSLRAGIFCKIFDSTTICWMKILLMRKLFLAAPFWGLGEWKRVWWVKYSRNKDWNQTEILICSNQYAEMTKFIQLKINRYQTSCEILHCCLFFMNSFFYLSFFCFWYNSVILFSFSIIYIVKAVIFLLVSLWSSELFTISWNLTVLNLPCCCEIVKQNKVDDWDGNNLQ